MSYKNAQILAICLLSCHLSLVSLAHADDKHEDSGDAPKTRIENSVEGNTRAPRRAGGTGGCRVVPSSLTRFGNGEAFDFSSMVTFLTSPDCAAVAPQVSAMAIADGMHFSSKPPFRLDMYGNQSSKNPLESGRSADQKLKDTFPSIYRENPVSSGELLPLVGQLAVLSPGASRFALAKVIEQEILAGDGQLEKANATEKNKVAGRLASTLVRLGATEPLITQELAQSVEDMALLSQADSLARYFRALSAAASRETTLVPAFNLSAAAVNRGVEKGKKITPPSEKLTLAVVDAVLSASKGDPSLEPGIGQLNEALKELLSGAPLTEKKLASLWKDIIESLAANPGQSALADVVASSLTPEFLFLRPQDRKNLIGAAQNYPQIAWSLQDTFLQNLNRMWKDVNNGRISAIKFNRIKQKHLEPVVSHILELDAALLDPEWIQEIVRRGLVKDADIEKRFPRMVLSYLDRKERASKAAITEASVEPTLSSMAENFAVLWSLSRIQVPVLMDWVKRNDQN